MVKMSYKEKIKTIEEKKKMCICAQCPSYNECAKVKNELLFCMIGKSQECIKEENGCICPTCPVTAAMGLKHGYYCTKGSEKELKAN